jgi:hypothetical protein
MKRFIVAASFLLIAATPGDVAAELEDKGYYIESGSSATEQIVSDAVFEARADGGRLYLVVLAEEPAGGATTFSDSVLDRLGNGYVVTVAPETVGFAGDGSFWTAEEMNVAIDASLNGNSDDQVIELFVAELTDTGAPTTGDGEGAAGSGLSGWVWMLMLGIGAAVVAVFWSNSSKRRAELEAAELERVKAMAREKLAEIANDIIEMEDEVTLSDDARVKDHYRKASATYTTAIARVDGAADAREMVEVIRELDMAIWELDAAEALLDGKPIPDPPTAPEPKPPQPPPPPPRGREEEMPDDHGFGRRSQRQSSYAGDDLMTALWTLLALSGRRHGGWGGIPGGVGGPMRGGSSGRMRGGGTRSGGLGRMRGGGRRR